jgi:CRISPR-associated protein Cas2
MYVVVAYDISENKRRLRVMKLLEGYGQHAQESVFECDLEPATYREMVQRLRRLIRVDADNVRFYHLCRQDVGQIRTLGIGPPVRRAKEFEIV